MEIQGIPDFGGTTYSSPSQFTSSIDNPSGKSFPQSGNTSGVTAVDSGSSFNWGNFSDVLKTIQGLSNLYFGFQQLQLGRDQFKLAKGSLNRNLANEAQAYNTNLESQQRARLAGEGNLQPGTPQFEQALKSYVEPRRVSGKPIG